MTNDDQTRSHFIPTKGAKIAHYTVVDKIGAGGMGEVFLAEDTKLGRKVALKFLPALYENDPDSRTRFVREARAAATINHPNIIIIHEVSEFENRPFIVMEYIEGQPLNIFVANSQLPLDKILPIAIQMCDGLAKAHQQGIIHRDIKSANIIIDKDHRPKILDFGLAAVQGEAMLTKAGTTFGTIAYMSPEQAQGIEIDHRSDLFSIGVVLYEFIAGRTPFKKNHDAATLHAIVNEQPEPLARYKSDVSPELQRIVTKCLAKNVTERYQSAADLSADLRAVEKLMTAGQYISSGSVGALRPSIAVLPFANMSADKENEYFSDGLTEELLNVLAKNPELKVIGRTSSFAFKGKQEDLREIGKKLGVSTILEGSVRKGGNRVRITAQLVNTVDGFHLWSETYDRVLDDIFAVQDDIAKAVSQAMHVTLVGVSEEKKKAVNPEAYALILRADQSHLLVTKESMALAIELYKRAIEIDPTNARAWAGLSYTYSHRVAYGHTDYGLEYPLAKEAAEKALALDEQLPQAHLAMYFVYGALELRVKECLLEGRKAYELAPNDSSIVTNMALSEMICGNFDHAIRLAKKAIDLDPLNPWARRELGRVCTFAGRLDEAQQAMLRALEMSPDMTTIHLGLSWIALLQGKFEDAAQLIEKEKQSGYRLCGQALVSHALGKKENSDRQLAELIKEGEQWSFQIANVYAYRGEADKAFEWLERGYAIRDSGIPLTKGHPLFKSLHSDPRWLPFLKKIGLD
jgi:serine/threonine protein kinase/Flp pilus assembly protein TadD